MINTISRLSFIGRYNHQVCFEPVRSLAHVVRRRDLDAALARRAVAAGARLVTEAKVITARHRPGYVEVKVVRRGSRLTLRARSVVLATGPHRSLLGRFGLETPTCFLQGLQLLCPLRVRRLESVDVYVGRCHVPGSFGWAVPLEDGWAKIGLVARREGLRLLTDLLEHPRLRGRLDLDLARLRCSPIPIGASPRSFGPRVLAVGEAAGQVKTTTNGGIYYGMLGARMAARTLGPALRADDLSAGRLREYEVAWRGLLVDQLETGLRLRSSFASVSDTQIALLMRLASKNGILQLIRRHADFDWHRGVIEQLSRQRIVRKFLGMRCPMTAPRASNSTPDA